MHILLDAHLLLLISLLYYILRYASLCQSNCNNQISLPGINKVFLILVYDDNIKFTVKYLKADVICPKEGRKCTFRNGGKNMNIYIQFIF